MHPLARLGALIPACTIVAMGSVAAHGLLTTPAQPALAADHASAPASLDQYGGMPYTAPYTMPYGAPYAAPMSIAAAPLGVVAPRVAQAATTVRISNFAFSPPAITVSVGQSVTWTNADAVPHTSTSDTGLWNSGVIAPGASYSMTFSTPGTFAYRCMIHPNMTGTVTVVAGPAGSSGNIAPAGSAAGQIAATTPATLAPTAGVSVSFGAGWNLVSGPAGATLSGAAGPLYTLRAGDTAYETVAAGTPLAANTGYWAYFSGPVTETLPATAASPASISLPAGQYVLVGNSGSTPLTVTGADSILTYDPIHAYQPAGVLQPGQGAWAFSRAGGVLSMQP